MDIAFICTEKLPSPAVKGGAIQMMIDGVTPFISSLYPLTIFSITDSSLPKREDDGLVKYIRFPRSTYIQDVSQEIGKHHFDIIHVFNRPKQVKLYKAASPNSRIVLSLHNEMFAEEKLTDEEALTCLNSTHAITTVSHFIKNTVLKRFPSAVKQLHVVYSGVDINQYPPIWSPIGKKIRKVCREKFDLVNKKVILFIGRLSKTKGPHKLIEAIPHIIDEHPDAVLVIVGGKWFSDNRPNNYVHFLYECASSLDDYVRFVKFIPPNKIPNIFLMGDVFVCSSQWNEPLARVHYEALAAGVPIITTDRGGNGEVIENEVNGLLIKDYKNPLEFARVINWILDQPQFGYHIANNGRKMIEERFQFSHVSERLLHVYEYVHKL
ncbi:glycosyltransferase family 4 protein [Bacillus carboniphilus]|uniref:Glycosyltransferase family 4 protein n=1 Tax=Bacillus carboniphilus TaxID=86663 RepID=A0ABY9JUA4_9BACI|nr:glycosyltransferase family 4 protein [Bacillus carboniphilus]WLR42996.1 glycosyltransferase family 4 protein [Bacillus carboniphilus]